MAWGRAKYSMTVFFADESPLQRTSNFCLENTPILKHRLIR